MPRAGYTLREGIYYCNGSISIANSLTQIPVLELFAPPSGTKQYIINTTPPHGAHFHFAFKPPGWPTYCYAGLHGKRLSTTGQRLDYY